MLLSLHVKNLAVIREEEVEFGRGLNILTGETGAGKSILLGSVELFLSGRSPKGLIRQGADQALVELVFATKRPSVLKKLAQFDVFPEDGLIVLSKKMTAAGRSLSRINGETVSAAVMRSVSALLLDIHGQQDSQLLRKTQMHETILDAYAAAEITPVKEDLKGLYQKYRELKKALEEESFDETERKKRLSLLRYEIEDIEKAAIRPGEDEELENEFRKLANGRTIASSSGKALALLNGENGILDGVGTCLQELTRVSAYDQNLEMICTGLSEVESLLGETAQDLDRYIDHFSYSEERLAEVEERLDTINRMKDRYGRTIGAIEDYLAECREEEEKLLHYEELAAQRETAFKTTKKALFEKAEELSLARKRAAKTFDEEIIKELADLNFLSVSFYTDIAKRKEIREDGLDDVTFMISLNPGEAPKPLSDVASGGELSRIMLAVRTVLADRDEIPTIIFDEIDAGISGRAAQKVADKLELIAKSRQVICITHLAQIAAVADHHFIIRKEIKEDAAVTSVREADTQESIEELARILGGMEITETVLATAREMKKMGD